MNPLRRLFYRAPLQPSVAHAAAHTRPATEAQAKAGNYRKGRFRWAGLTFAIENPKGSTRSGVDRHGKPWSSVMTAHYGYILDHDKGKDGDPVDVFVGPDLTSPRVFVVDQVSPDTGAFDEHKTLIGYHSLDHAKRAYLSNYARDWQGLGAITEVSLPAFREWLKHGDKRQPMSDSLRKPAGSCGDTCPCDHCRASHAAHQAERPPIPAQTRLMAYRADDGRVRLMLYAAKATPLKQNAQGQHVSSRSKTGDAGCSRAVSAWVRGNATKETHKKLAECRAQARGHAKAHRQRAAGHEARAQHIEHILKTGAPVTAKARAEKAKELKAKRAKGAETPKPPSSEFSLKQDSAIGRKSTAFDNSGAGRTGTMFDMRKGDLPGQTSIFDKVGTVDTRDTSQSASQRSRPTASSMSAKEHRDLARAIPPVSGGSPAAIMDRAKQMAGKRSKLANRLSRLRKQAASARIDPASHTNHAPGTVTELGTHLVDFDPGRFQYKMGHGAETGSVGSLSGVKRWDPELGGAIQVWKDPANGKTYVVNGHNRLDLAKKLGVNKITARFINAKDAREARGKGALTNIAEGRGTALDAAKFFKDTEITKQDLEARGIPMREKIAQDGLALANLSKPIFQRVLDGDIPVERAAIIGSSGLDHNEQKALVDLMDKQPRSRPISNDTLRELTDTVRSAGKQTTNTFNLFGESEDEQSLALHKAKLQADIKNRLSREKRLFGTVAKSRAAEDLARAGNQINTGESARVSQEAATALGGFDLLKNRSGPVARVLNQAAERIHAGENAKKVTDDTYARILRELPEMLASGQEFAA